MMDFTKWRRQYYCTNDQVKFRPVFISDNAITLSDKVQLIIRFYGDTDKIHENYDFVHAKCYYDYAENKLVLPQAALEATLSKTLMYEGSLYPIASLFRIRKFIERGWRITADQMHKMLWQVNELNLKDPAVLRDQLMGVDQAYMSELLRIIENEERLTKRIDSVYLAKLIDKIFQ